MNAKLQPLRLPGGWSVEWNQFYEIDPLASHAHEHKDLFSEDLLQLKHRGSDRLLDLGWYPEQDLAGEYRLEVYHGDFRGKLLHQFRSRSLREVVTALERATELFTLGNEE